MNVKVNVCGYWQPLRMPEVCSGFARGAVQGRGLEFQPQHGGGPRQLVDESVFVKSVDGQVACT